MTSNGHILSTDNSVDKHGLFCVLQNLALGKGVCDGSYNTGLAGTGPTFDCGRAGSGMG